LSSSALIILFIIDLVGAVIIAKFQQNNGYKFLNSFVGALIGLIGLSGLCIKAYLELMKL